jgi:hypothetical protein
MTSLFIKGTALVTRENYFEDPTCLGSYLLCAIETWVMMNFANTGEFTIDYPNEVKRKYGEVRSANEAFQNDIHNLTIGYHQMKSIIEDEKIESGLKSLYLGNLVEHYITNIRCIYDHMAVFSRIVVDHCYLPLRAISSDSLNALMTYIKKNDVKSINAFSEPIFKQLVAMEPSLKIIKAIRDAVIHDGKEPMITFSSGTPQIRINKSNYKRDESILPNLLDLDSVDYPMFPYLQHVTKILFANMERLGEEIIRHFIKADNSFRLELVALIGICVEDFVGFLHKDYDVPNQC